MRIMMIRHLALGSMRLGCSPMLLRHFLASFDLASVLSELRASLVEVYVWVELLCRVVLLIGWVYLVAVAADHPLKELHFVAQSLRLVGGSKGELLE